MQEEIIKIEKNIWNAFSEKNNKINDGLGLYMGLSGMIMFYDFLFDVYGNEEFEDKLLLIIEKADELIESQQKVVSLCSGVAGYGLALLRLKNKTIEIDQEYFESIDTILLEYFELACESNDYDFMHEGMGIAMYFVERHKADPNEKMERILSNFAENFIRKINLDFKNVLVKNDESRGDYYSFGLAHGVASYINFLIYLNTNYKLLNTNIDEALKTCTDFLLSYKEYNEESRQYYANVISIETNNFIPSRLSWCQGDLGVSNAFYNAGLFLHDTQLKSEAIDLMRQSASLRYEDSGINDFGICHGTSGILLQLFLASKKYNIKYDQEINSWLEVLKEQTADFEKYPWYDNSKLKYFSQINLLIGAVGLGLTLLTIDNKIDVEWLQILNLH